MTPLAHHVAVVTGAGSGIGRAVARALATQCAGLALVGRNAGLEEVAAETASHGCDARVFPADLTLEPDVRRLAVAVQRQFDRVDILVHCAAFIREGSVSESTADDFDRHYRTNLLAPCLLTRELLPALRRQAGQIVFMNSSVGLKARAGVAHYAATKHGLKALADSLREEVNQDRIRVLSVFPGRTATPAQERLHAVEERSYRPDRLLQPEDVAAVVVQSLGLPRTAEVTDLMIRPMNKQ